MAFKGVSATCWISHEIGYWISLECIILLGMLIGYPLALIYDFYNFVIIHIDGCFILTILYSGV